MKRVATVVIGCAAAALVAALLAGCGQINSLSRSEWVTAADGYCNLTDETNAATEAEFEKLFKGGLTTPAERTKAAELVRVGVPNIESGASNLDGLKPPPASESREKGMVAELERKAALEGRYADALEHGSAAELEAVISRLGHVNAALEQLANELETKICGRPEPEPRAE